MSEIFQRIRALAARREVFVSDHGYGELAADAILIRDVFAGVGEGVVLEEYPSYHRGPCVLVLQRDHDGKPIHGVGYRRQGGISSRHRHCLPARPAAMEQRFPEEKVMTAKRRTKFVHEGQYAAEVEIEWVESDTGWSPYLSLEDAEKLDQVRDALRTGDLKKASQLARVYQITPLNARC